jgi:hypothetical protein
MARIRSVLRKIAIKMTVYIGLSFPAFAASAQPDEPTLQQQYLGIYLEINDANQLEKQGNYSGAVKDFTDCYAKLTAIHESDPNWESALIIHRMDDCRAKVRDLQSKTGVGGTLTLTPLSREPKLFYPWKLNITATIFWIGEGPNPISSTTNVGSAWEEQWRNDNGGPDSPYNRSGYAPATHAARINPFYVALPFNDLAFPDKARRWIPKGWQRASTNGKPLSACKDRWVEIKNALGDDCYAQWEDVGPIRNDHAEYVFGDEPPGPGATLGLCVSPAVADYLNINEGNRITRWRFVDDGDVRPGAWLKYDEEALLFRALHQTGNP